MTQLRMDLGESPDVIGRRPDVRNRPDLWPAPTTPEPDDDQLRDWVIDSVCEATDGCETEPDGQCEHGHPSWLLRLGLI